jgi:hypothetical protein
MSQPGTCQLPPPGWSCSRAGGHDGTCNRGEVIRPGDSVEFLDVEGRWLARAATRDNRYVLLTTVAPLTEEQAVATGWPVGSEQVHYTIIDWRTYYRGPLNIIGGGLGIMTSHGPDEAIDRTIEMLEEPEETWELSHRNRVPLAIARVDRA